MTPFSLETRITPARKITPYIPLLGFILIAAVFAITSFQAFLQVEGLIVKDKIQDLDSIADLKVRQISDWKEKQIRRGESFTTGSFLPDQFAQWMRQGMPREGKERILRVLGSLRYMQGYKDVTLFDQNGMARLTTILGDQQDPDDVAMAWAAIAERRVLMSDIHPSGARSDEIRIDLAAPLVSLDGKGEQVVGAVVLQIDPQQFLYPFLQSWPFSSPSAETLLVRRDGDDVLFLSEVRHMKGAALSLRLPLTKSDLPAAMAVLGKTSSDGGIDYRGVEVVSAMRPVPGTHWFIVSKIDKAEFLAPVVKLKQWSMSLGLALALIGGMLVYSWLRVYQERYKYLKDQHDAALEREMLVRHFELLTKYANDIILVADVSTRIVEANDRALEAFGYTREELLGMQIGDFRDPSTDLSDINEKLSELMSRGELRIEYMVARKDGSTFPVEISARVIEVRGKRYLQGILRDITERRRVEDALRKSEALLKASQQMAHIGSWELDLVTNTLSWSDENYRIFEVGPSRFEACYEAFLAAVHPDDLAMVNQAYTDSVKNRTPYRLVHRLLCPEKRVKYVEEWCETFYDEDGTPLRSVGTTQDVTQRHLFEESLAREQDFIRQVVDTVPNVIFVKDTKGRLLLVNQAMAALHGKTPEDMVGRGTAELFRSPEEYEIHLSTDREVLERRRKVVYVARNVLDGREKWLLVTKAPMEQPDGTVNILGVVEDITEKRLAEDKLRSSADEIEDLYDNAPCGYHSLDQDGVFVRINNTELKWLGYTRDEIVGKMKISQLYTPKGRQLFERTFPLFKEQGAVHDIEVDIVRKDGTQMTVLLSATAIYDAAGRFLMSRSTMFDITVRRHAEEGLRLHSAIISHMEEGIFLVRASDGLIVYANPKFEQMFGYAPGELLQRHVNVINSPSGQDPERTARVIVEALIKKRTWQGEVLNVKKDGTPLWCHASVSTFEHHAYGTVWISIHQDITERILAEKKLNESEARFRAMADNAPIMIWVADAGVKQSYTCRNFFNQGWHDFTGLSLEQIQDHNWQLSIHPDDREHCLNTCLGALVTTQPFKLEYRLRRYDGVFRWIQDSGVPRFTEDGEFLGFIGTCVDVTDQKLFEEMRAEIEHVGRLNIAGEMASGLAHELSQPLTAASNYLDGCLHRMQDGEWDREKLQKAVKLAHLQTERAGSIINHLKDLIRKQGHERAMMDINQLIKDSVDFLEHDLNRQSIRVIPDFVELPQVRVNKIEIEQVLLNLMKNAIDSMAALPRRELRLSTRLAESDKILITVGDTGKGVPAGDLEQVFNPFQTSKQNGLGLGLAICRSLVENYGGRIWAEQNGDAGMEFSFTLPTESIYE